MADSDKRILEARERFHLLRSVHSLFSCSLPTVQEGERGRYGSLSETSLADLVNDITILRSDIKSLPIKLQQIDLDQLASDADVHRLTKALDSLLSLFENSVLDLNQTGKDARVPQVTDCAVLFPRLTAIGALRRQHDDKAVDEILANDHMSSTTPDSAAVLKDQIPLVDLGKVTSYINFPPPQNTIASCRFVVEGFGKAIADIFPDSVRRWNVESLLEEVTDAEIQSIKEADAFCRVSSSLFSLLHNCITCEAEHVARLHLSGFHTRQMEMLLGTDEHDWIPARFTPSGTAASSKQSFSHRMCAHLTAAEYQTRTIQGCFNETTVWEDCVLEHALYDTGAAKVSPNTLDDFLQGLGASKRRPNLGDRNLDRIGRKIVGLLLACSLFQLCGSPWLQDGFEGNNIFFLKSETCVGQLDYWRPYISCDLSSDPNPRSLPEDVAALGVLILELEANFLAEWTDDDEDYDTMTKSNKARLSRILKEWKGELPDRYHGVGSACFMFEQLVEDFDHPSVDQDMKGLAILYKCVVNPLFRLLVSDFGAAERLFQGISGLSVPKRHSRATVSGRLVLYDDWESTEPDKKSEYADDLIRTLDDGFLSDIRALRQNSVPIGLAERLKGMRTPERIRIAVLDTGIDPTDKMIKAATSRIIDKRSWVGPPEGYIDTYGHGTHVTRLLLKMAPAAEIYVAKITDQKNIDPENMSRIAQAINWAVDMWDVHIISMSFGFEDQNKAIDDAIERAFKADKLMFAAASNEGGNRGRSRPGRNPNVICMHACDGKGNKGDMSPSPMRKKDNFTTLGIAVNSRWKKQTVYKSGTSFATPVAAAIAADVLEFANFKCQLSEEETKLLYKRDGMLEVFRAMSTERDGYDYVQPGHLWDGKDEDELAKMIRDILEEF